jgi:hypothetical protein
MMTAVWSLTSLYGNTCHTRIWNRNNYTLVQEQFDVADMSDLVSLYRKKKLKWVSLYPLEWHISSHKQDTLFSRRCFSKFPWIQDFIVLPQNWRYIRNNQKVWVMRFDSLKTQSTWSCYGRKRGVWFGSPNSCKGEYLHQYLDGSSSRARLVIPIISTAI